MITAILTALHILAANPPPAPKVTTYDCRTWRTFAVTMPSGERFVCRGASNESLD